MALAAWRIGDSAPERLPQGAIELEVHLEEWIEQDPGLIDPGLLVVQRQMRVDGGFLDLLCVDPQGRVTIVEIKRGKLIRETIAQSLDYASSIASYPVEHLRDRVQTYLRGATSDHPGLSALFEGDEAESREVAIVVVGVGKEPGLERMIDFLGANYGLPIRAVTFDVFQLADGEKVLVREETEPEVHSVQTSAPKFTAEGVIADAGGPESPNGRRILNIVAAAEAAGLFARPYKRSFMITPPTKRTRFLMVVGRWEGGDSLWISYSADAIAEFFPIEADAVRQVLGPDGSKTPIPDDATAEQWAVRIRQLFTAIGNDQSGEKP